MKASTATSNNRAAAGARPTARTGSSSSTDEHFRLDGPSRPIDERIHAWRKDLADIGLAGRVFAPHYARPLQRACGSHAAFVWAGPGIEGDPVSQLLPGEGFGVLEYAGGRAWGFCTADHVVGYVEASALADPVAATHIVSARHAPVAADDAPNAPVVATLPMGARLEGQEAGACLVTEAGCVSLAHLRRLDDPEPDAVAVAERLLGARWRPGGRTEQGIDAAALVQLALGLAGIPAPRLLDQLASFGTLVPDGAPARRGDLVLFEGGAGLMADELTMIHAGAEAGKVVAAPAPASPAARRRPPR